MRRVVFVGLVSVILLGWQWEVWGLLGLVVGFGGVERRYWERSAVEPLQGIICVFRSSEGGASLCVALPWGGMMHAVRGLAG